VYISSIPTLISCFLFSWVSLPIFDSIRVVIDVSATGCSASLFHSVLLSILPFICATISLNSLFSSGSSRALVIHGSLS
jgi:hypothetical protein